MDPVLKKQAINALLIGLAFQVVGFFMSGFFPIEMIRQRSPLLISIGFIAIMYSCLQIAKAKGYAWYWGLLGMLGCVGFGIVWFLLPAKSNH